LCLRGGTKWDRAGQTTKLSITHLLLELQTQDF
jgi:hypothetical protein